MKQNLFVGVAFVTAASLATAGPKGTIPKASADSTPYMLTITAPELVLP